MNIRTNDTETARSGNRVSIEKTDRRAPPCGMACEVYPAASTGIARRKNINEIERKKIELRCQHKVWYEAKQRDAPLPLYQLAFDVVWWSSSAHKNG